jgi:hypothetical protein
VSKLSEKREAESGVKSGPRWLWIAIALALVVIVWGIYYFYYAKPVSTLDGFAKCLTSRNAKMYGLYWCPHCEEQKEMFGYAVQYVNYVECGVKGVRAETEECKQAGVKNFPTWQFADGSRLEGAQPLAVLGQKTGCSLP